MTENPYITISQAKRYYIHKHVETIRLMCVNGVFKTARQIGLGNKPTWQIARAEVAKMVSQQTSKV